MSVSSLSEALAALTASGVNKVTAAELRDVVTWLASQAGAVYSLTAQQTGATYTAAAGDLVRSVPPSGGQTITLPTPTANARVGIKRDSDSAYTLTLSGTVDGVTNPTFSTPYEAIHLIGDGTKWLSI